MRSSLATALLAALALGAALGRPARAAPDAAREQPRIEANEVRGGFSKRFVAGTVPATLPRATPTTARATPTSEKPAGMKVTVEVGAD